ncbi:MAG TPA: hypothetical protein GXZ74_00835 [Tissierellia bacterium]|nr:hypothetical protein [Tissierellia bacterium]
MPMTGTNGYQTTHVRCVGKKENRKLIKHLRSIGYQYYTGSRLAPKDFQVTGRITDEEDTLTPVTCYAIDESLKLVAYHNSMSMLMIRQLGIEQESAQDFIARTR